MEEALRILDMLEGYRGEGLRNHYERRPVSAVTADGTSAAWVCLASVSVLACLTRTMLWLLETGVAQPGRRPA